MNFEAILEKAFQLYRVEENKRLPKVQLVFFMDHGTLAETKYGMDPSSSIAASDFVHKDLLLGFPVHPVLSKNGGAKPPTLTCINLYTANCFTK